MRRLISSHSFTHVPITIVSSLVNVVSQIHTQNHSFIVKPGKNPYTDTIGFLPGSVVRWNMIWTLTNQFHDVLTATSIIIQSAASCVVCYILSVWDNLERGHFSGLDVACESFHGESTPLNRFGGLLSPASSF